MKLAVPVCKVDKDSIVIKMVRFTILKKKNNIAIHEKKKIFVLFTAY